MSETQSQLNTFVIYVNGRPYLGESDESANAMPRHTGWTGKSPGKRTRIKLGELFDGVGRVIVGKRNLRSEIERILAEADAGMDITKIEIEKR
jgi:hypothetical protein